MDTDKDPDLNSEDQPPVAPDPDKSETLDTSHSLSDDQVAQVLDHPDFASKVDAAAEKKSQGVKDRRFNRLENQQNEILAKLKLTPEQQTEYEKLDRDARLIAVEEAIASGPEEPASPEPQTAYDIGGVFKDHGYDLANLTAEDYALAAEATSKEDLSNRLFELKKSQPKTDSSGAGVTPPSGGNTPPPPEGAALKDQYLTDMVAARGKPDEVEAIMEDYRERGLDVDNVITMG